MSPLLLVIAGAAIFALSGKKSAAQNPAPSSNEPSKNSNPNIPGMVGQQLDTLAESLGCKMDDAIAADPAAKAEFQKLLLDAYSGKSSTADLRAAANKYRRARFNSAATCLDAFANYFDANKRR